MLAACSICILKTINYIEVLKYIFGINGLIWFMTQKGEKNCSVKGLILIGQQDLDHADSFINFPTTRKGGGEARVGGEGSLVCGASRSPSIYIYIYI